MRPISSQEIAKFTPVMQQYLNERNKLSGHSVLFFRMGDFYEAFFDDAEIIARELEITLTGRPEQNYLNGRIPMAGVPAKAIKSYIPKLLDRNFKIYIAEQMADPKTCKGLVPREITKIFTPGTINDLDLLNSFENNFVLAISYFSDYYGLAYADISTGEFFVTHVSNLKALDEELARIQASEILAPSGNSNKKQGEIVAEEILTLNLQGLENKYRFSLYHQNNFNPKLAKANIEEFFKINSALSFFENSFGAKAYEASLNAAGALVEYIKETHSHEYSSIQKSFTTIQCYQNLNYMILDPSSRRNLELTQTLSGKQEGSLFHSLDRTASKSGRRRLKAWLEQPLLDIEEINRRQDAIEELINNSDLNQNLYKLLRECYDLDRLSTRLASELINPRELNALKDSLYKLSQIAQLLSSAQSHYLSALAHIPDQAWDLIRSIEEAILDEPNINITEGLILKHSYHQDLRELISLVEDSETWLSNFEEAERNNSGIKTLKVSFNKVHGYYLETSRLNQNKLPENYVIKQTMVNTIRAVTPELKDFEEKITNAESRRNALEYELFTELKSRLALSANHIKDLAIKASHIDALNSLALIAIEQNYCRPNITNSLELKIKAGRHPVVEQRLKLGEFIANDIKLNQSNPIIILTGPNMAGKSTYMRQNAVISLLAQIGSFVPASYAEIGLIDRIYTRIGASDDLASGQSTFMVEMNETAVILSGMTERSLIIFDEIGRGTSTYDGVAIAWSIVEHLAKTLKPRTIFATHYHELSSLERLYSSIKNFQVLVSETNNQIQFLHKVTEGSADRSYGIEVARLAGLPKSILDRARAINNQLQSTRTKRLGSKAESTFKFQEDNNFDISSLPLFDNF